MSIYTYTIDDECIGYNTGDFEYDPIVIYGELYFPIPQYPYVEDWESHFETCGNMGAQELYENRGKFKNFAEYMDYLSLDQVWRDHRDESYEYLQIKGSYTKAYSKAGCLEHPERMQQLFEKYSDFILISKNSSEQKKCAIPEQIVMELEDEFSECTYDVKDFKEMAETYYITVNPLYQDDIKTYDGLPTVNGQYVGTIFMDNNGKLYYCNKNNPINNEMTQKINAVLEEGNLLGK